MSKIDERKEFIGALKVYLGFILAIILAVGSGTISLFQSKDIGLLFYLGIGLLFLLFGVFYTVAYKMHKTITELKDI
jgi:CHASE3 domain sensor protein